MIAHFFILANHATHTFGMAVLAGFQVSSAGCRVVADVAERSRSCLPVKGRVAGMGCLPCTGARGGAEDENTSPLSSFAMFLGRTSEDPPLGKMGARPGLDSHHA